VLAARVVQAEDVFWKMGFVWWRHDYLLGDLPLG